MKYLQKIPKTLLISSNQDPAGTNIHNEIRRILPDYPELSGNIAHLLTEQRLIYLDGPYLTSDVDQIIFLSRHASQNPRPVLTVHVTGNFGSADYGGIPGKLTPSATPLMHAIMKNLHNNVPNGYEVMYEATHHGPTDLVVPSCFVEIGSTEKEWNDVRVAKVVAKSVMEALMTDTSDVISLAGFGGTHYAVRQTEIAKTTRGGFGHIMPTRDIRYLTTDMFQEIIRATRVDAIYIDGKALSGPEEHKIKKMAEDLHIPLLSQSDLIRLSDLPFLHYCNIRRIAEKLFPGSRVIIHDLKKTDDPVVIELPKELLEEVMIKTSEEFICMLDPYPVAHISGQGKACHPMFISDGENSGEIKEKLIYLCITLLQREYDTSFDGDCIVIRKTRFDPAKATELKIPTGPLYGELMSGKPVMVNGVRIMPDMVMTRTEKSISIQRGP